MTSAIVQSSSLVIQVNFKCYREGGREGTDITHAAL